MIGCQQTIQETLTIDEQLIDESNKIKDKAVLSIYSDGDWSGADLDSGHKSATRQGIENTKIIFDCKNSLFGLEKGTY